MRIRQFVIILLTLCAVTPVQAQDKVEGSLQADFVSNLRLAWTSSGACRRTTRAFPSDGKDSPSPHGVTFPSASMRATAMR